MTICTVRFISRRKLRSKATVILFIITLSLVIYLSQILMIQPQHHQKLTVVKWSEDVLRPDNRRIFFHETSCRNYLNVKQCCAVESAAKHNPTRPVLIFLHADKLNYSRPFISVLEQYDNVIVILLNETEYFSDTPLEKWYLENEWRTSWFKVVHMSDYVRMLTIYKGGGFYMDLDYITLKPLDETFLRNFFLIEGPEMKLLSNSVLHLDYNHRLISEIIKRLVKYYKPDDYFWHGPSLLSSVMGQNCSVSKGEPNSNQCTDVKLLAHDYFCPITNNVWEKLFRTPTNTTYSLLKRTYAVHTWSGQSKEEPLDLNSHQLYAVLAAEHCPLTVAKATPFV